MENKQGVQGKWVVAVMLTVALILALMWWKYIPRTNPRAADPGSPYYSQPAPQKSKILK